MEALAALGLASNILQFVEFSTKIVRGASNVYQSASGLPAELQDVAAITESLGLHMNKLAPPPAVDHAQDAGSDALVELANGCRKTCAELQQVMEKIRGKEPGSRRDSLRVAWRALRQKEKLEELEKRLDRYRSQILTQLLFDMRDNQKDMNTWIKLQSSSDDAQVPETRTEFVRAKEDVVGLLQLAIKKNQPLAATNNAAAEHGGSLQEIGVALSALSTTIKTINAERQILNLLWFSELNDRNAAIGEARRGTYRWLLHDPDTDSEQDVYDDAPEGSPPTADLNQDGGNQESGDHVLQLGNNGLGASDPNRLPEATALENNLAQENIPGNEPEIDSPGSPGNGAAASRRSSVATKNSIHKENIERKEWRERFVGWLRDENGLFYISGKPGSGKSTLMKSIANDSRTQHLLQGWAQDDGKGLILVQFFFWNSGTELQQNIEGLYRSILWEVLKQRPELTSHIFPGLFREAYSGLLHQSQIIPGLLEAAFKNIIANQDLLGKHKVCFFIDGLDEYKGDYWKLAKYLKSWCSIKDVKLCLSSRPYNEFVKVLTPRTGSWLKLHELTRGDILRVVRGEFTDDERFLEARQRSAEYAHFVDTIVMKAEGVFIWVTLAIRSILSGIGNSCSLPQLQKRLEGVPNELGAMFRYMLGEIEPPDRKSAARTFLMLKADDDVDAPTTWVYLHAIIDELLDQPDYETTLCCGGAGPFISNEECVSKCTTMADRITGRCHGLVQVIHTNGNFPGCHRLQFVHRTVADFLGEEETMTELRGVACGFRPLHTLAHGLVSMAKHVPRRWDFNCPNPSPGQNTVIRYRFERDPTFLLHAILLLERHAEGQGSDPFTAEIGYVKQLSKESMASGSKSAIGTMWFPRFWLCWDWFTTSAERIDTTILCLALFVGAIDFVKKELLELPQPRERMNPVLLASSLVEMEYMGLFHPLSRNPTYDMIGFTQYLLEHQVSPNNDLCCTVLAGLYDNKPYCPSPPWTPWTTYLFALSQSMFYTTEVTPKKWEERLRLYLRYGADPSVCFIGYRVFVDRSEVKTSANDSQQNGISLQASGPLHGDLSTMLDVWGLERSLASQPLGKKSFSAARAQVGRWIATLAPQQSAKRGYQKVAAHDFQRDEFLVLKVVSFEQLDEVRIADLEDALHSARQRLQFAYDQKNVDVGQPLREILLIDV